MGQVARGEWALLIISTPVMFYAAQVSRKWNTTLLCILYIEPLMFSSRIFIGDPYRNFGPFGNQEVEHRMQLVFFVLGV